MHLECTLGESKAAKGACDKSFETIMKSQDYDTTKKQKNASSAANVCVQAANNRRATKQSFANTQPHALITRQQQNSLGKPAVSNTRSKSGSHTEIQVMSQLALGIDMARYGGGGSLYTCLQDEEHCGRVRALRARVVQKERLLVSVPGARYCSCQIKKKVEQRCNKKGIPFS